MKEIILECLSQELYSDNIPNALTERTLRESNEDKNVKEHEDLEALRSYLGI